MAVHPIERPELYPISTSNDTIALYFEGVPSSQSALVDRLRSWFETENRKVPDDSTIKKKLKPLWQIFLPEAERRSA